jgi:hypothetical protein
MPLRIRDLTLIVVCLASASFAQQTSSASPIVGRPERVGSMDAIVGLLRQSHELNNQLPLQVQYSLLQQQLMLATQVEPELGRQWQSELSLLAAQMKAPARSQVQDFAMPILARLDPDHADELLHQIDLSKPFNSGDQFARSSLIREIFEAMARSDGEAGLPAIESEAAFLGSTDTYPYSAVGLATSIAVSKYWPDNKDHAIAVEQSALDRMFSRYSTTPHTYYGDYEFGEMLKFLAGSLPFESVKPPLNVLVTNLLATDTSKYHFEAAARMSDGQTVKADNAIDAALLWFAMLVRRDAELTQQLESMRPQLRDGLEYAKTNQIRGGEFRPQTRTGKAGAGPRSEASNDAIRVAHINPDAAVTRAKALPAGPERSFTLLEVARTISGDNPDRAAQLVAEAGSPNEAGDEESQVDVISVKASIAAVKGRPEELKTLLKSGYELAARFISPQPGPIVAGIAPLVQLGIQNDPDLTQTFFQTIPPSLTKALLLLDAAEALNLRQRLPLASQRRITSPAQSDSQF